jgi:clan AA aspartic protease
MIEGAIRRGEAVVDLNLTDSVGRLFPISAVVDTGFNGSLTLPAAEIERLALTLVGKRRAFLADASVVELEMYATTIIWNNERRRIVVSLTEGGSLLGMDLLRGSRLTMDVVEGGPVVIEKLPAQNA